MSGAQPLDCAIPDAQGHSNQLQLGSLRQTKASCHKGAASGHSMLADLEGEYQPGRSGAKQQAFAADATAGSRGCRAPGRASGAPELCAATWVQRAALLM